MAAVWMVLKSRGIISNKKLPFSVGKITLMINLAIFTIAGFVFPWEQAMYSVIAYFIASKIIDIVVLCMKESKWFYIISEGIEEIGQAIMARLEESKMKEIVRTIDTQAFLAIGNMSEVKGGRFKKKAIH